MTDANDPFDGPKEPQEEQKEAAPSSPEHLHLLLGKEGPPPFEPASPRPLFLFNNPQWAEKLNLSPISLILGQE